VAKVGMNIISAILAAAVGTTVITTKAIVSASITPIKVSLRVFVIESFI
jgi:hypothetical protein